MSIDTSKQAIEIYTNIYTKEGDLNLEGKGILANLYL